MPVRPLAPLVAGFLACHVVGFSFYMTHIIFTEHFAVPVRVCANGQFVSGTCGLLTELRVELKRAEFDRLQTLTVQIGDRLFSFTAAEVNAGWEVSSCRGDRGSPGACKVCLKAPPEVALPRAQLPPFDRLINWPGAGALFRGYLPWVGVSGFFLFAAWLAGVAGLRYPPLARAIHWGFRAASAGPAGSPPARSWTWFLGGVTVVLLAFVWLQALEPCYFLQDDSLVQWFPIVRQACQRLWDGELPEWNPYQFAGAPVLSLGYYGLTYPPLPLAYGVARYLLGNDVWTIEVFVLLHLLAGYALCYACGRSARLQPPLAMAGALCMVLSGYTLITGRSWSILGVTWLVWLPLLTLCLIRLWRGEVGWKWALGTGLAVGAWYHVGFSQMWVYGVAFFGLAIGLLWRAGELPRRRVGWAAVALAHGLALALPLLYVQTDVIGAIERGSNYGNGITQGSMAMLLPYPLAAAAHPNEWGTYHSELMGQFYYWGTLFTVSLLFALMLPVALRGLRVRIGPNLWLILAAVALLLTLGHAGVLWTLLSEVPFFGRINNHPFRVMPEAIFFGVLGGGLFLQRFLSAWPHSDRWLRWLALGTAALLLYHVNLCRPAFYSYGERPYPPLPEKMRVLLGRESATATQDPDARVLSLVRERSAAGGYMKALKHSLPTLYHIPSFDGYDPLVESTRPYTAVARRLQEEPVRTAEALGVRWVLAGELSAEPTWPAGTVNHDYAYNCPRPRPLKFAPEVREPLEASSSPRLELDGLCVRELPPPDALAFWEGRPKEGLPIHWRGDGADVSTTGRPGGGTLVVNVVWRPQWQAFAGDAPLALREDGWHRMVLTVPPGTSEVSVRFRPPWRTGLYLGLLVEADALLASVILAFFTRGRRRGEGAAEAAPSH